MSRQHHLAERRENETKKEVIVSERIIFVVNGNKINISTSNENEAKQKLKQGKYFKSKHDYKYISNHHSLEAIHISLKSAQFHSHPRCRSPLPPSYVSCMPETEVHSTPTCCQGADRYSYKLMHQVGWLKTSVNLIR